MLGMLGAAVRGWPSPGDHQLRGLRGDTLPMIHSRTGRALARSGDTPGSWNTHSR
jgi:hypothetical protein